MIMSFSADLALAQRVFEKFRYLNGICRQRKTICPAELSKFDPAEVNLCKATSER